jgi:RNA 2',3'-cyclic 3'-phosphodiesterase
MRAFIALELPANIREQLNAVSLQLQQYNQKNINWVDPQNLHITFQFLGDIAEAHLNDIKQIMAEYFADLPHLSFSQPQLQIVPASKPRIIWVHYQTDSAELNKAHRKLNTAIAELGYKLDRKPLLLHVTLARIKTALQPHLINAIMKYKITPEKFAPDEVTLFKSILKPQGPIYQPLFSIAL